jgi:hypothetical protein
MSSKPSDATQMEAQDVGMGRDRRHRLLPFIAVLAGLSAPVLLGIARLLGRNIPQPSLEPDYVTGVVWAFALGVAILVAPLPREDKRPLLVLWLCKCLVTLGFMLFYEYSYGLDSYMYFATSLGDISPVEHFSMGQGTELIQLLSWYQNRVFPDSYHALKVTYAFVGLIGIYLCYRAAVFYAPKVGTRLLYFFGLFPSILFWSSVLGKDPVVLFGIGAYAFGTMGWSRHHKLRYLVWLVAGVTVAAAIRIWLAPILMAPLLVFGFRAVKGVTNRLLVIAVASLVIVVSFKSIQDRFALMALADLYAKTQQLAEGWGGGSGQEIDVKFTSIGSMIAFLPQGVFTALFRPLPGEVMNAFGLLAGLENLFLLGLVARALRRLTWRRLTPPVVQWMLLYVVCWATLYGFVAGNLGSAVRFKMQVLPALLSLLLVVGAKRDEAVAPPTPPLA